MTNVKSSNKGNPRKVENPPLSTSICIDEKALSQNSKVIPTENIPNFESDRSKTSIFVSKNTFSAFSDACHLSGRKTCDVIEPMMEAYVKIVKNKVLGKVEMCPFKAVEVNIGTLQIMQKYETRGRKPDSGKFLVKCPKANKFVEKDYCHTCKIGGHHGSDRYPQKDRELPICEKYFKSI